MIVSLSDIEQPVGKLKNGMTENSKELNNFMNDNAVTEVIGNATNKVPSVVKIFASSRL